MDSVDDIALGEFPEVDLSSRVSRDDIDERGTPGGRSLRGFRLSLVLSAGIHLVLASTVFFFVADELQTDAGSPPVALRVQFVSSNPLLVEAELAAPKDISENSADAAETAASIPMNESESDSTELVAQQSQLESSESSGPKPIDIDIEVVETVTPSAPSDVAERVSIPSVDSVLSAINAVQRSETSQFYTYDCNKIEAEKKFNRCAPQDSRDYISVTKNPVYEFYNPALIISRSRETVTTIARQSASVTAALASADIPSGLSGYVLEEVERGIETYSNNSNRAVTHMDTMQDKSAAGAQARRVFDHWVVQQSAQLRSRRVENRRDTALEEKCNGYQKFIMAAAEFAECSSLEVSPFELNLKF